MFGLFLCYTIITVNIEPRNAFLDYYTIIPPLGQVQSLATSHRNLFALSDNYLLILDKPTLRLEQTIYFDQPVYLVAYDQYYDDLWIVSTSSIICLTLASYSTREYPFGETIEGIAVGPDLLYLDAERNYSLDRITGEIKPVASFPTPLSWFRRTASTDIRKFPLLNPYFYIDDLAHSATPFRRFPITAIYDEGMNLYVGTKGYGILRYNTVSWQKERIIYGPLDAQVRRLKRHDGQAYLVSASGVSVFTPGKNDWQYLRFERTVSDLVWSESGMVLAFDTRLSKSQGALTFPVANLGHTIIALGSDETSIYIGTNSGLFKLIKDTKEPLPFGPDQYAVYVVRPETNAVYVGGEIGFYRYDQAEDKWSILLNRGIKEIVKVNDYFVMLGVDNQLIKYWPQASIPAESAWVFLPYFNIYDIATDGQVVYCASFAGIAYYEPTTDLYKTIFNLPRISYNYVFVAAGEILAVSSKNIYRLPISRRD